VLPATTPVPLASLVDGSDIVPTDPVTTASVATSPPGAAPTSSSPFEGVPAELAGIVLASVRLDGVDLQAATADTAALRARGLMQVTDLGSVDGMLFVWPEDTTGLFWMKGTLITLDIAWFDHAGRLVSALTMSPCGDADPCPRYTADGPYRYALEVPSNSLTAFGEGSILELDGAFDPT
jgi:uncharacterized membrane protein (UPF0127 family)